MLNVLNTLNTLNSGGISNAPIPLYLVGGNSIWGGEIAGASDVTVNGALRWVDSSSEFQVLKYTVDGSASNNESFSSTTVGQNVPFMQLVVAKYGAGLLVDYWQSASSTPKSWIAEGWNRYNPADADATQYLTELKNRYTAAKAWLDARGINFYIAGIIFCSSLGDAVNEFDAYMLNGRWADFVNDLRDHTDSVNAPAIIAYPYANGNSSYSFITEATNSIDEAVSYLNNSAAYTADRTTGVTYQAAEGPLADVHPDADGYITHAGLTFDAIDALNPYTQYTYSLHEFAGIYVLHELDDGSFVTLDSDGYINVITSKGPYNIETEQSATLLHHIEYRLETDDLTPYMKFVDSGVAATSSMIVVHGNNDFNGSGGDSSTISKSFYSGNDRIMWVLVVIDNEATGNAYIAGRTNAAGGKSYSCGFSADDKPAMAVWFTNNANFRGVQATSAIATGRKVLLYYYDGTIDTDTGSVSDRFTLYHNDADTEIPLSNWINNGAVDAIYQAGTSHWTYGQASADGIVGDGNPLGGKLYYIAHGVGPLTAAQKASLMSIVKDKYIDTGLGLSFSDLGTVLPGCAFCIDPNDTTLITKDANDLVSAVVNTGSGTDGTASGTSKPKWVQDAFGTGKAGLQGYHDGSNLSVVSFADNSVYDHTNGKFDIIYELRIVSDPGALTQFPIGKWSGTTQREWLSVFSTVNTNAIWRSTAGTSATTATDNGTTTMAINTNYIIWIRGDGTNVTMTVNNDTVNQAILTTTTFGGTAPLTILSADNQGPLRGYFGRCIGVFGSNLTTNLAHDIQQYLADDIGVTLS